MAYCPKCKGEMGVRDVVCPHCGYDFPPPPPSESDPTLARSGIAYSALAGLALAIGEFVAGLACILATVSAVAEILRGHLMEGLVRDPITAFLSLAMLVVFIRVRRL
jgi:hypothetical protein